MSLWSNNHLLTVLPTFAVLAIVAVLMRIWLINKPYEMRMIPIKIISIILILIEIGKQAYSISIGYNLYHIPLHFCSIFIYVLPLMAFYRGKHREKMASTACAAMTSLFIGMLVMPNVIYSEERITAFFSDYLSFHTVFFHNIVIFALFLVISLDLHKPSASRGELLFVIAFGAGFVALAATASYVLQTNFSNFLFTTVGVMQTLVEAVQLALGEVTTKIIYIASLAFLHILLLVITNYVFLLICFGKEKLVGALNVIKLGSMAGEIHAD
ncbi:MAG: YwaF family protein [Clostridia bacterium]|nr:YwaF family protein [Clostridia bacterium]